MWLYEQGRGCRGGKREDLFASHGAPSFIWVPFPPPGRGARFLGAWFGGGPLVLCVVNGGCVSDTWSPFGWICEAGGSRSRKRFAPSPPLLCSLRAEGPRAPSWQLAAVDSQGVVGCRAMNGGMLRLLCPICRASHLRVFFRRLRSVREEDETPRGVRRRCNDPFSFFPPRLRTRRAGRQPAHVLSVARLAGNP